MNDKKIPLGSLISTIIIGVYMIFLFCLNSPYKPYIIGILRRNISSCNLLYMNLRKENYEKISIMR